MRKMPARMVLALFAAAVFCAPPLPAQSQSQPSITVDPKKAAEEQKKAEKKAAEQAKKAAEDARNAEESARKKEAAAKKKAATHKNNNVDEIGARNINKGSINFASIEEEIAVGRQASAEIEKQVQLVKDPMITEYVNRIGQNIVNNSDAKVPFTIKVIDADEINAFALPGGFFYVNTGVILAADDEAELAGVMAHEIAHVAARHAMENESKAKLFNILSIPAMILGGPVGMVVRQSMSVVVPLQFIKFSKGAEAEADFLGVQYLDKTGYDPSAAVSFFEKLEAKEQARPGTMSDLFSSHPPTEDRIIATKAEIETVLAPKDKYVVTTSEFQRVKKHLLSLQNNVVVEQDDKRPSLVRRRSGRSGDTGGDEDTTSGRPEDRTPPEDDRPVLQRRN